MTLQPDVKKSGKMEKYGLYQPFFYTADEIARHLSKNDSRLPLLEANPGGVIVKDEKGNHFFHPDMILSKEQALEEVRQILEKHGDGAIMYYGGILNLPDTAEVIINNFQFGKGPHNWVALPTEVTQKRRRLMQAKRAEETAGP